MHQQWYDELVRILLCRLPIQHKYIGTKSHQSCEFGRWLYSENSKHLRKLPAFVKMEQLHAKMHESAREMCMKMQATGLVQEQDYDYFMRNVTFFRKDLSEFKFRVLSTLSHVEKQQSTTSE
ncbi:CZB domain-containing protein [Shewanella sp. C32]|uniref:CZB domain-containing protein n=1 Tax=Shewanella electrica TaxID=515560 RepID=A0ABT2FL88_9GAMM|nr:CZB domain-containing protein [Shewanella electrica]MCH1924841.1 CZB domain-containing protein [Shewanella electrica]MCS4556712.1 CZB domain-containing protein [Shewanella electrica]